MIITLHDRYFAQELVLGGDDDADGVAGDVRTPGGEALEGDEVAGLDEGDEGALLVDTPEIDVTGTGETDQAVAVASDGETIGIEAEGEADQGRDSLRRCTSRQH